MKKTLLYIPLFIVLVLIGYIYVPMSKNVLYEKVGFSFRIYDRNGLLLRQGLSTKGFYFSYAKLEQIPNELIYSFLVLEDKNFFSHSGIDIAALFRAFYMTLTSRGRVYGGSTITMQVARNIFNLKRNIFSKLFEMYYSQKIEVSFSKSEILGLYCNTIPFGNKIIGVKMAARHYFNKNLEDLSLAECAYLGACIKYPNYINTDKRVRILRRKDYILKSLLKYRLITKDQYMRGSTDEVKVCKLKKFIYAPHFTDFIINRIKEEYKDRLGDISEIHTTLDLSVQKKVFNKAAGVLNRLLHKQITNASVIVLDNDKKELIAMLGSLNYFSNNKSGQVNGSIALRSPGSTLKPFTYATAFEKRVITPATVIPDVRIFVQSTRGDYSPQNDDRRYHGPVTARKALACSYNVPAARVINMAGVSSVYNKMKECNITSLTKSPEHYGASLVLGGADLSLFELTRAYMVFANNGMYNDVKMIKKVVDIYGNDITKKKKKPSVRVFSKETCFLIKSILSDNKAREDNFTLFSALNLPFFCASKTGTSKGYRNNWTIGFSKNYTVGVWVGNFNNRPMQGVSGITGAGSIYRNIMLDVEKDYDYKIEPPKKIEKRAICPLSGLLARKYCNNKIIEYFIKGTAPKDYCDVHHLVPFYKDSNRVALNIRMPQADKRSGVVFRTILVLPDKYSLWLTQKGYKLPSKDVLKYIKKATAPKKARILFPDNNDVFAVDPIIEKKHQRIKFRASLPVNVIKVLWVINNKKIVKTSYPFFYNWQIKRGEYRLVLTAYLENGETIRSNEVKFSVN